MTIEADLKAIKKALYFILENEMVSRMNSVDCSIRNQASEFENEKKVFARSTKSQNHIKLLYLPILKGLETKKVRP